MHYYKIAGLKNKENPPLIPPLSGGKREEEEQLHYYKIAGVKNKENPPLIPPLSGGKREEEEQQCCHSCECRNLMLFDNF